MRSTPLYALLISMNALVGISMEVRATPPKSKVMQIQEEEQKLEMSQINQSSQFETFNNQIPKANTGKKVNEVTNTHTKIYTKAEREAMKVLIEERENNLIESLLDKFGNCENTLNTNEYEMVKEIKRGDLDKLTIFMSINQTNKLTDTFCVTLSNRSYPLSLLHLILRNNDIRCQGVHALTQRMGSQLITLDLFGNHLGDNEGEALRALCSKQWEPLLHLYLGKNNLSTLKHLNLGQFPNLQSLSLALNPLNNGMNSDWATKSCNQNGLSSLISLNLSGTAEAKNSPLSSIYFGKLTTLYFEGNQASESMV